MTTLPRTLPRNKRPTLCGKPLDGLLHVSEIAHYRVKDVRDELKEGEQVMVKVINIDPSGKIRLSRKVLLNPEESKPAEAPKA